MVFFGWSRLLCCCAMLIYICPVFAQDIAKGYVYEDRNGNGKKEKKEPGLAKVPVSNGHDVVVTDRSGRFQLPVSNDDILFVIKPSGFNVPLSPQNLPAFYYIHKPQGSPKLKYYGTAPTGNLPVSVDFGLVKQTEEDDFQVLVFGDPQVYNNRQLDYFQRGIIRDLEGKTNNFSFGISLGDLVGDDLSLYKAYNAVVRQLNLPWHNVIGNHDLNFDVKADSLSDEGFEAEYGPATYAFNYGKVHFVLLDNILYPDPRDGKGYWGGLREDQLKFIENDLKLVPKDRLIVLCHHIPLFSDSRINDSFRPADRQRLFNLLKQYPYTLSLSAHTHIQQQYYHDEKDGLHRTGPHHEYNVGTTSGDWYTGEPDSAGIPAATMRDGTPKGYAFLNFKGNSYQIDYRVAGAASTYKINIYTAKAIPKGRLPWYDLYANFFQGSSSDTLEYRIDEGNWKRMNWTLDLDPAMCAVRYEWDKAEKPLVGVKPTGPSISRHLWKTRLAGDLEPGLHIIQVRAKDASDRIYTNSVSFEITEPDIK